MSVRILILSFIITSSVVARRSGSSSGRSGHYPPSYGYSGTGSGGAHNYPHSTGLSGNTYTHPSQTSSYQNHGHTSTYSHRSEVHHHYHYSPPQYINYGSANHPVYHSNPPLYIYEYRDSGSRFDNLLTGLALYNLGRMSGSHSHYDSHKEYRGNPGEICKLGISKNNGEYEETRIDCKLMSSFIWEAERDQTKIASANTNTMTRLNVTQTIINSTNSNNTVTTVTVQNTTIVDAIQVKGPSLNVSPGMNCYMIRSSRDSSILKKKVECGLLQAYAQNSLRYNGSGRSVPWIIILVLLLIMQVLIKI